METGRGEEWTEWPNTFPLTGAGIALPCPVVNEILDGTSGPEPVPD